MKKKMTPQEYRKELLRRRDNYFGKIQNSTLEDNINAQISGGSMAEAELDKFLDMDFTDDYNLGTPPSEYKGEEKANYIEFLKAFNLPTPNGEEPEEEFELPEE